MTNPTPELEAVARAIAKAATLFEIPDDEVEDWIPVAKAALLALQEPTEGMREAGASKLPVEWDQGHAAMCWTAICNYILGERS